MSKEFMRRYPRRSRSEKYRAHLSTKHQVKGSIRRSPRRRKARRRPVV